MLVQDEGTIQPFLYHARPRSHIKLTDHKPIVSVSMQQFPPDRVELSGLCTVSVGPLTITRCLSYFQHHNVPYVCMRVVWFVMFASVKTDLADCCLVGPEQHTQVKNTRRRTVITVDSNAI